MFQLSSEGREFVKKQLERFESKHSAVIPALWRAQKENGWISDEVVSHLAQVMDIPVAAINETASFYTMFNKKPVGKHHIQVCCNISCAMAGARELVEHTVKKLGVLEDHLTADGRFTVTRVECLGACDKAPMAQIGQEYYHDLTPEKMDQLLKDLK